MVKDMSFELPEEARSSLEKNALLNAIRHGGKADAGAVISKILGEFPSLRAGAKLASKAALEVVGLVNSLSPAEQEERLKAKYPDALMERKTTREGRVGLPPLPGAEKGAVVLRLPP